MLKLTALRWTLKLDFLDDKINIVPPVITSLSKNHFSFSPELSFPFLFHLPLSNIFSTFVYIGKERKVKLLSHIRLFATPWTVTWRRQWHPTPVLLPGKSHGQRSLVGCSLWGREESDTTERHHFLFSLSCIGEGNGNPLQCSCLENPRDGGAWWAAVYRVALSRTRLKRLSSSSSHMYLLIPTS